MANQYTGPRQRPPHWYDMTEAAVAHNMPFPTFQRYLRSKQCALRTFMHGTERYTTRDDLIRAVRFMELAA